ncbi:MAG TPA: recombinase family protein [Phycisphaerales bacterium]|nr:recombinase family protein [Phycisphaerales bacterium]
MTAAPAIADTTKFAVYMRTSTDDQQSPEDSRRWQLDTASRLIAPHGGVIVETYHDVDVSREVPWARRAEATRLLSDAANKTRGWSAVVIAEPSRAFSGGQFQLVFPQLTHYDIELWVPELGGRVDPESEGHEMMMGLFGGLSKAERRRVQVRTRNSTLAHAAAGRWLGGRPNYGYRVVDTPAPHPQRQKAAAGIRLRTLEPDPDTAPVVRRIFEMADAGFGYRAIATVLESEGIPSPGEVGPTKHPRSAGIWAGSAVRAILCNPRYTGLQVVGRQRRRDELIDPTNPAVGTRSHQRRQREEDWVRSEAPAWPAIIEPELFHRVSSRIVNNYGSQRRLPRTEPGKYLLSGLMRCGLCGRSMHGAVMKGKAYYRCSIARRDYAATDHPPATSIREERILHPLDQWLESLVDPRNRDATVKAVLAADANAPTEPASVRKARRAVAASNVEMDRVLAALRAGLDPELATATTRAIQADRDKALAEIDRWERENGSARPLTAAIVEAALDHAGGVAVLLSAADRPTRASLYRNLGLELTINCPDGDPSVTVRYQLDGGGGRI